MAAHVRLGVLLLALWGCSREQAASLGRPLASSGTVQGVAELGADRPLPYPPGKWRDLAPEVVAQTKLWLSDVVIHHDQLENRDVSFHLNGWGSAARPAKRSRGEALALARRIVQEARDGSDFATLARQFSDEPETASRGGSLGGLSAGQFLPWPQVLDALETLAPGAVSDVVETETGYHIFQRRARPPEATVSGRHLVIGHDAAPWLELVARGPLPQRSRADALALAERLYETLQAHPNEFERLVAEHSEHRDATRGGDLGSWSTWEYCEYPREIEALEQLKIGELAPPIDSLFGIQIIQRVENRSRPRYAMTALRWRFDPAQADEDPASKHAAQVQAEQTSLELRDHPERFNELQQHICCSAAVEVVAGRALPALESALAQLRPGQIAKRPIEDLNLEYLIPRRLELAALSPVPETLFELPRSVPRAPSPQN